MQIQEHFSSFASTFVLLQRRWQVIAALALGPAVMPALAGCPSQPGRFVPNGAEVTDSRTGLIWARCSAGQSWDGSACTGNANRYTHEQALEYAATQSGWRLPSVKELFSLADRGCRNPAIDTSVFPNTVTNVLYWSATPDTGSPAYAWVVYFSGGYASNDSRNSRHAVRLVRTSH